MIPGGKIQPNEDPRTSAAREAMEEGGALGWVGRSLGIFDNLDRRHRTAVFVLHVDQLLDVFEESAHRRRRWFKVEEAMGELSKFKPLCCNYLNALQDTKQCHHQGLEEPPDCSLAIPLVMCRAGGCGTFPVNDVACDTPPPTAPAARPVVGPHHPPGSVAGTVPDTLGHQAMLSIAPPDIKLKHPLQ